MLSAKADMSSIPYEGRADVSGIEDIPGMSDTWRTRLKAGIEAQWKSQREVSLAAGMGSGYVNSLFNEDKDPTVDHLLKVCEAAGLSLYYVLYGVDIDREAEEIIRLLKSSSEGKRAGVLQILRDAQTPEAAE